MRSRWLVPRDVAHTPAGRPRARHWLPAAARRQPPRWPYHHQIIDTGMRKLPLHHPAAIKPLPLSPYAKAAPLPSAITVTAGEVPRPLASVAVSHP
jgi:hypothetical protein